jgi:hypothetical protein
MKNDIIKKIETAKKDIYTNLEYDEIKNSFSDTGLKLLYSCLESIFNDIDFAINEKEKENYVIQTNTEHVNLLLNNLEKMIALQALSEKTKLFINSVLQCIFNYNKNILKNNDVNDNVMVCQRLLTSMLTMGETINILKSLIMHLESKELKENQPLYNGLTLEYIKLLES